VLIPNSRLESTAPHGKKGLAEVGGANHVLLTTYTPDKNVAGQGPLPPFADMVENLNPVSVIQTVVQKTHGPWRDRRAKTVVVTAMTEPDLRPFIYRVFAHHVLHGWRGCAVRTHVARAAFPRLLGGGSFVSGHVTHNLSR